MDSTNQMIKIKFQEIKAQEIVPEIKEVLPPLITDDDLINSLGVDVVKDGEFRLQGNRFLLTYKTHIDKKEIYNFLKTFNKNEKSFECYICHENGTIDPQDGTHYEHTHVYVNFGNKVATRNSRKLDFNGIHPHIKPIRAGKANENKVKLYICKEDEDPDLVALKELMISYMKSSFGSVEKCDTLAEALERNLKGQNAKFSNVSGIVQLFNLTRPKVEKERIEIDDPDRGLEFTWQKTLWDLLTAVKWNSRIINCVVDYIGGSGKTKFTTFFDSHFEGVCYFDNIANTAGTATIIADVLARGEDIKYIFVDLPRATSDHKCWSTVESLLNGKMTATKYHGGPCVFKEARVVIFSNWFPPFDPKPKSKIPIRVLNTQDVIDWGFDCANDPITNPDKIVNAEKSNCKMNSLSNDRWNVGLLREDHKNPIEMTTFNEDGSVHTIPDIVLDFIPNPYRDANRGTVKRKLDIKLPT